MHWQDHPQRIEEAWREVVGSNDWVLVPGDVSWAMRLEEAAEDLAYLGSLPGEIVILRGNHDYWWQSIGKVRSVLPPNVYAIQNDCLALPGGVAVCGTRGWELPSGQGVTAHDLKVYDRETARLRLSLQAAKKSGARRLFTMMHFPPAEKSGVSTGFTALLEDFGVELCVYGHLHAEATRNALRGCHRGIRYEMVAADAVGFRPFLLTEFTP